MTRFARAKGSKASNERVPEKATPWSVMKEEMQRQQQEAIEQKEREKHNKIRQENYDNFLKERSNEVKTEWADFPETKVSNAQKVNKTIKKEKKISDVKKNITKKNKISKNEILEMLKPDAEVDAEVKKLTSKLDKILDKKKSKKKQKADDMDVDVKTDVKKKKVKHSENKKVPQEETNFTENTETDAPEEISSKVKLPEVKVTKKKNKKMVLKIPSVAKNNESAGTERNSNEKENLHHESQEKIENPMTKSMKKRLKQKKRLETKKSFETENSEKKIKSEKKKSNEETEKHIKQQSKTFDDKRGKGKSANMDNTYVKSNFATRKQKMKVAKVRDNKEHKRRKPDEGPIKMVFNGKEVEIVKFDGFPVRKQDADRLNDLRKQMISKGIPRSEVQRTMQLERRRAEKALAREKKNVCYHCRKSGHMLSECPELNSEEISFSGTGICFKCGSTEHTHFECKVTKGDEFKFASCFICREQGHIARQCPDNPKGLYPQGGACKLCGDVTHFKKDCPQNMQQKEENAFVLKTISGGNIESIDDDSNKTEVTKPTPRKNKVIKF